MHFHLPKPLHGWREFSGEVGIIVVGVLIALAAEQVVEQVHDRQVADETRQRAARTSASSKPALRGRPSPASTAGWPNCRNPLQWEKTGHFATPQWVAQPPELDLALPRYEAAAAAGRLTLLPSAEQYRMARSRWLSAFALISSRSDRSGAGSERSRWGRTRCPQQIGR